MVEGCDRRRWARMGGGELCTRCEVGGAVASRGWPAALLAGGPPRLGGAAPAWALISAKVGAAVGTLARLAHLALFSLFCPIKARRKEREGDAAQGDPKLYLEETLLERTLPDLDMRQMVEIPAGIDYNEWLASHTLALFDHVNLIYGTLSEFCTATGCPDMSGPGNRAYPWFDEKGKKTRVAAPQYIDYVMTFTQKTVSDENIFPTKYANEFPTSFESIVRKILRLLFHVIAHLYAVHFREVVMLRLHGHLNLTFSHLTVFHRRFGLIEPKETDVLRDLEIALRLTDEQPPSTTCSIASSSTSGGNGSSSCVDGDASLRPIVAQPESQTATAPPGAAAPAPA